MPNPKFLPDKDRQWFAMKKPKLGGRKLAEMLAATGDEKAVKDEMARQF